MPRFFAPTTALGLSCEALFQSALETETGIEVTTINAHRARIILYAYRSDNGRSEFANVTIRLSPDNPETDLWLLNFSKDNNGTEDR